MILKVSRNALPVFFYGGEKPTMLLREKYINNITSNLSWLVSQISQKGVLKLYDDHIHAESFFCGLLNIIFGYQLTNANFDHPNAAAIDLLDATNRIAVQVTTDRTAAKVRKTLEKFGAHALYRQYDRLIILIIGDRPNYRATFEVNYDFTFSAKDDIWGVKYLIEKIGRQDTDKLAQISDYIDKQLIPAPRQKRVFEDERSNISCVVETMKRRAAALCSAKLQALGLTAETAEQIIQTDINASKYQYIFDGVNSGRHYLEGDFGTGKSHAILIMTQQLADRYLNNLSVHVPLFVQAREIVEAGSIQRWIEGQKVADADYFLFVDGLDEIETMIAKQIRDEVDLLAAQKIGSRIVVATRPMAMFQNDNRKIAMRALAVEEQQHLYATITNNHETRWISYVEPAIAKMLKKPFFCIIFSLFQGEPQNWAKTDMDLVAAFIDRTIATCGEDLDEVKRDLSKIAAKSVDINLDKIHISSVRLDNSLATLLKTGLIVKTGTLISFPLPIIAQWLAAEAICYGFVSLNDIIVDKVRTNRWMYALSILFSQMTYEESREICSKIVRTMPGVAAHIIKDGIRFERFGSLPTALECGKMLQECMQVWTEGLGPLSQYIAPEKNGKVLPLGICVEQCCIEYSWDKILGDKTVYPMSSHELHTKGCHWVRRQLVPSQATWPWIITLDVLSSRLKEIIENHEILIDGQLKDEFIWSAALRVAGKGTFYEGKINLACFAPYDGRHGTLLTGGTEFSIDRINEIVDEYKHNGITEIGPPYPLPDKRCHTGMIWKQYTKKRCLEKIRFVYQAALRVYMDLMDTVFVAFRDDLCIAQLYPCKLVGGLQFPGSKTAVDFGPSLTHYWEALPYGEEGYVDIQIRKIPFSDPEFFHRIGQNNANLRPEFRIQPATTMTSGWLDILDPTPVTDMVFSWLNTELKELGWIQ